MKLSWVFLALSSWLGASEKVVFQEGLGGYGGTFDRLIIGDETAVDGSLVGTYTLDGDPIASTVAEDRALLIRFDALFGAGVGQVPTGATILTAKLMLTTESGFNNGSSPSDGPYVVGQLTQAVDGTTSYSDLGTVDLSGPRGSVVRPVQAGFVDMKSDETVAADVTAVVRNWHGGATNNGFAIYSSFSTDSWVVIASGNSEVELRPRLEVEFTTEVTEERSFVATRSALLDSTDGDATTDGSLISGGAPLDNDPDNILEGLFAFDGLFGMGAGQIPEDKFVVKAELVLTTRQFAEEANFGADSLDIFGVFPMNVSWNLDDLDGDEEPDLDFGVTGPTIADGDIDCAVTEFSGVGQDSQARVDITQLVREWQTGRANEGVNVKMTSGGDDSWYLTWPGTTGTDGPRLVVTTVDSAPIEESEVVEFREGLNGYEGTFQMRVDLGGGRRLPEDFGQYALDGYPSSSSPEDASDLLRFDGLVGSGDGQIPADATVLSAQLEYSTSGATSSAASGGPFVVGQLNQAVDASTLYSDLSGVGEGNEGVRGSLEHRVAGYSRMRTGERVSAEVSAIVQDWVDGAMNEGFGVYSSFSSDGWIVGTACDVLERRPSLHVRYTSMPTETKVAGANLIALMNQTGGEDGEEFTEDGLAVGFAKVDADANEQVQILLKFDFLFGTLQGQVTPEDEVLQAWLILNTGDLPGDDSWGPVEVREMLDPWSLSSVWSDFGADGPSEGDSEVGAVIDEFFGMGVLTECRVDVTDLVKDWQSNGVGEGLIIQAATTDSWWIEMPGSELFRSPRIQVIVAVESGFGDWASALGFSDLETTNDDDGDGYDALVEYGMGLNPGNFDAPVVLQNNGGGLQLAYAKGEDAKVDSALSYAIEWSEDLQEWHEEEAADDGLESISVTIMPSGKRFYRLVVSEGN